MKIITHEIENDDIIFCPHCNKDRKVVLMKDDPDNQEPNLVVCWVCTETIAIIDNNSHLTKTPIMKIKTSSQQIEHLKVSYDDTIVTIEDTSTKQTVAFPVTVLKIIQATIRMNANGAAEAARENGAGKSGGV